MAQGNLLSRCQSHYILVPGVLNDLSAIMVSPTVKQSAEATDYTVLKIFHVIVMFTRGSGSEPLAWVRLRIRKRLIQVAVPSLMPASQWASRFLQREQYGVGFRPRRFSIR